MDNPLKAGIARVEVELLDINDNQPQFEVDVYNISIVENLPNGFSVLQVVATDQDQVKIVAIILVSIESGLKPRNNLHFIQPSQCKKEEVRIFMS